MSLWHDTPFETWYNIQGDVTHIVDMDRNIVASYDYDPYGKILNLDTLTDIGKINPFRYRGYYYDSESDLYYLNSRYYNPETGDTSIKKVVQTYVNESYELIHVTVNNEDIICTNTHPFYLPEKVGYQLVS